LAIVLSVLLSFGHCVVCSSVFWPLCCLFFFDIYGFWLPFGIFKLFLQNCRMDLTLTKHVNSQDLYIKTWGLPSRGHPYPEPCGVGCHDWANESLYMITETNLSIFVYGL
jgi:hypothetical protein